MALSFQANILVQLTLTPQNQNKMHCMSSQLLIMTSLPSWGVRIMPSLKLQMDAFAKEALQRARSARKAFMLIKENGAVAFVHSVEMSHRAAVGLAQLGSGGNEDGAAEPAYSPYMLLSSKPNFYLEKESRLKRDFIKTRRYSITAPH